MIIILHSRGAGQEAKAWQGAGKLFALPKQARNAHLAHINCALPLVLPCIGYLEYVPQRFSRVLRGSVNRLTSQRVGGKKV